MTDIQWLVDEACLQLPREKRERTGWWASQLGTCPTGQYLQRAGVKPDKEHDARTLRVFRMGDILEEFVGEVFELSKDVKDIERQHKVVDDDLHVTGKIDFILTHDDDTKSVVEVKSKHSMAFWHMLPGWRGRGENRIWKEGEGGNEHHLMQLWFYLYKTNTENGSLLYISKDDLAIHSFPVSLHDEELRDKTLGRIQLLNDAWERQEPPACNPDPKHWTARYCSYHQQCMALRKESMYA